LPALQAAQWFNPNGLKEGTWLPLGLTALLCELGISVLAIAYQKIEMQ
jgi:hypothetical protein